MIRRVIRHPAAIAALTVLVLQAAGGIAGAANTFTDIASSPFHDQIVNVAGAGIASGFPDGTFRPKDAVTRQQFAAWTNRSAGRVSQSGDGDTFSDSGNFHDVSAPAVIDAGATGAHAAGGFVLVNGSVTATTDQPVHCPCNVQVNITDVASPGTGGEPGPTQLSVIPGTTADDSGFASTNVSVTGVFPIDPDTTGTYHLRAAFFDANVGTVSFNGQITALYVPFGPHGTNGNV